MIRKAIIIAAALAIGACGETPPQPEAAPQLSANANPSPVISMADSGKAAFAMCSSCHPVSSDGQHGMGPNLADILGAESGTRDGFAYSDAMQSANIIWTEERLDAFLADPYAIVPGTAMAFPGEPNAEKRALIVSYLGSQGD
ncbi:MAG: c-type cytochrome [Pseudomonadota bacterium]